MTPSQIKSAYYAKASESDRRRFFDRDTMRWFGDTMRSFGTRTIDGRVYMYRKRDAMVNVFGHWKPTGREFFNAWLFIPETGDLKWCDNAETQKVYDTIYG